MTPEELYHRMIAFFSRRRNSYQMVFGSSAGRYVLADMMEFCCADRTTVGTDGRVDPVKEGRRQAFMRMTRALNLTPDEQYVLATQKDKP